VLGVGAVEVWLGRVSAGSRRSHLVRWRAFMAWLRGQPGWADATPEGLLDFQEGASGRRRFEVLNLVQGYVVEMGGARKGMLARYSSIRSFFLHNRVELPHDRWDPGVGTREPTKGRLTVEGLRRVIEGAGLRDRAVLLTFFQGLMDLRRFLEFNGSYAGTLVEHLKKHGVDRPFRIDFLKGRKTNHKAFYTFIGQDALSAWQEYFEKQRGWPKPNEALAVLRGTALPMTEPAIRSIFDGLCFRYGLKPKKRARGDPGNRTGVNLHEFRDVARSYLQTAKRDGLDETCVEFWMGHTVDPLNYNKFAELNPKYVEENYEIAERYLNILSAPLDSGDAREQAEKVTMLEKELAEMKRRMDSLQATVTGTIQQLESRG